MVKTCEKIINLKLILEFFTQNQWIFGNRNCQLLRSKMNDFDRQVNHDHHCDTVFFLCRYLCNLEL